MKKNILIMALTIVMVFSFAGCSSNDSEETGNLVIMESGYAGEEFAIGVAKENTELYNEINTALQELIDDGTVGKIEEAYLNGEDHGLTFQQDTEGKEEIIMATNAEYPPYESYDGDVIVGIDPDIAAAIADKLDMKLVIDDMAFGSIIPAVQAGKADFAMAGLANTEERQKEINFTVPYSTAEMVMVVKEGGEISSFEDLSKEGADFTIGVQTNSSQDLMVTEDFEATGLATISRFNSDNDSMAALKQGKIDCMILNEAPAIALVNEQNK